MLREILQKHTHIGFDLDETLAGSMMDMLHKFHREDRMHKIRDFEDITSLNWMEVAGCDMLEKEMLQSWKTHSLRGVSPLEGAIYALFTLAQHGKKLSIITARNEHDHRRDIEEWVGKFFPMIGKNAIYFSNKNVYQNNPKSPLCKKIGVTLMFDDSIGNALELRENGVECILVDKPWNRAMQDASVIRMKHWDEVTRIFNEEV